MFSLAPIVHRPGCVPCCFVFFEKNKKQKQKKNHSGSLYCSLVPLAISKFILDQPHLFLSLKSNSTSSRAACLPICISPSLWARQAGLRVTRYIRLPVPFGNADLSSRWVFQRLHHNDRGPEIRTIAGDCKNPCPSRHVSPGISQTLDLSLRTWGPESMTNGREGFYMWRTSC